MIVDFNAYCGNWPYWPIKHTSSGDIVALMDRFGIDRALVCSTEAAFVGSAEGNAHTASIVAEQPGRLVGFASASPTDGRGALEDLARCREAGMAGLRLFPQHHGYRLDDDPVLAEIMRAAADWRWPVLVPIRLIMSWAMPVLDVREVGNLAGRYPDVRFIIGGVNYGEMRDALAVMRRNSNVSIETSCLQAYEGVKTMVEEAGAGRVYFGSGLPLQYPAAGLAKIQGAEIGDQARAAILGGNAAQVFGW